MCVVHVFRGCLVCAMCVIGWVLGGCSVGVMCVFSVCYVGGIRVACVCSLGVICVLGVCVVRVHCV